MKFLVFFLLVLNKIVAAQLLTVNNLEYLTTNSVSNLDTKLAGHFGLTRYMEMEDANNRVYSNDNPNADNFKVVTVFTDAKNCLAISVVTHDQAEIKNFHEDLLKEGFNLNLKDGAEKPVKIYSKQNVIVSIREPDSRAPVHQVIWRCRE